MPRNPRAEALRRAAKAEANYRAAVKALDANVARRKAAIVACVRAGCSATETGKAFGVSRQYVHNVVAEMKPAPMDRIA